MLPFASAANAEMLAHRSLTDVALLDKAHHFGLAIMMLLTTHLQVDNVSRRCKRHKDHHVVDTSEGLSFGRHIRNHNIFEER